MEFIVRTPVSASISASPPGRWDAKGAHRRGGATSPEAGDALDAGALLRREGKMLRAVFGDVSAGSPRPSTCRVAETVTEG